MPSIAPALPLLAPGVAPRLPVQAGESGGDFAALLAGGGSAPLASPGIAPGPIAGKPLPDTIAVDAVAAVDPGMIVPPAGRTETGRIATVPAVDPTAPKTAEPVVVELPGTTIGDAKMVGTVQGTKAAAGQRRGTHTDLLSAPAPASPRGAGKEFAATTARTEDEDAVAPTLPVMAPPLAFAPVPPAPVAPAPVAPAPVAPAPFSAAGPVATDASATPPSPAFGADTPPLPGTATADAVAMTVAAPATTGHTVAGISIAGSDLQAVLAAALGTPDAPPPAPGTQPADPVRVAADTLRRQSAPAAQPMAFNTEALLAQRVATRVAPAQDAASAPVDVPAVSTDGALSLVVAASTPAAPPPVVASQPAIDITQQALPAAMIAHIEKLRDAADAVSTSIRILPDALGAVDVSITKDGELTHVHLAAENAQTRALLAEAQPKLAELAEQKGMKLGQTSVGTQPGQQQGADQQAPRQHQPAPQLPTAPPRAPRATSTETTTDKRLA